MKKIWLLIIIVLILAAGALVGYRYCGTKTFTQYILDSNGNDQAVFSYQYPARYTVTSAVDSGSSIYDGKPNQTIVQLDSTTFKNIDELEKITQDQKNEMVKNNPNEPGIEAFVPGYTTRTIGSLTAYYLNDRSPAQSTFSGTKVGYIFGNNQSLVFSYQAADEAKVDQIIQTVVFK